MCERVRGSGALGGGCAHALCPASAVRAGRWSPTWYLVGRLEEAAVLFLLVRRTRRAGGASRSPPLVGEMMGHAEPLIQPESSSSWKKAAAVATGAAAVLVLSIVSLSSPISRSWRAEPAGTLMSDCEMAAAELSTAYQSTGRFTGSTTAELQEYLTSNGVIVSVCVDVHNNCSTWNEPPMLPDGPHHWSGSWISATSAGGIYPGVGQIRTVNVGVIARPQALTLRCMYPSDGATSVRDDDGCGPFFFDSVYGSRGAARLGVERLAQERAWMEEYRNSRYPGRDWRDIECQSFFATDHFLLYFNATTWRAKDANANACEAMKRSASVGVPAADLAHESIFEMYKKQQSAIYGAPLCVDHNVALGHFWEYVGECSWAPTEFQAMVDAMNAWFAPTKVPSPTPQDPSGTRPLLWNELVAPQPASLAQEAALVRAVFYMVTPQTNATVRARLREDARKNAKMYSASGGSALASLPVLELDETRLGPGRGNLFRCVESE